jgi:trehalose 6-phosphate phosphatase
VDFTSDRSRQRYDAFVAAAAGAVIGLDMDGTLSPIVDDPTVAHIHPDAPDVLVQVARAVRAVAIITGRPARQALALGGLDEVGTAIGAEGRELYVFGQYGHERWSSSQRRVISPRPPLGLGRFLAELPGVLRRAGATEAYVEEKGLGVAVHTRRMPDSQNVLERVLPPVAELAQRHGLLIEPGRHVVEVRAPGTDKGQAVHTLIEELGATAFLFAGDDLGDLEAFDAVDELAAAGMPTLLVCSASREESVLRDRADVVVPGPPGVLDLLRRIADDAQVSARRR